MEFDRKVPHEGVKISTRVENGKAHLEFEFLFKPSYEEKALNGAAVAANYIRACIYDRDEKEVFRCIYPTAEEEPLMGILLHPHLWNGMEEPCFYRLRADLLAGDGSVLDCLEKEFLLRTLEEIPGKGWFLNGRQQELRAVALDMYSFTNCKVNISGLARDQVQRLLLRIKEMGANALYISDTENWYQLQLLCEKLGFLVWKDDGQKGKKAAITAEVLFSIENMQPTDHYYLYKARWSRELFVHVCMSSIKKQENETYSLIVYSNQKKLALYVDGMLHEFRSGGPEYFFEEIPAKHYPLQLSFEAGESNISLTNYICSQNVHKYVTFL